MKDEILNRFDAVMGSLKPIEVSPAFDFEFRRRFEKAVAEKYKETAFERVARRTAENLRYAFFPKVPAVAMATATLIVLMAAGLFMYSIQPARPLLAYKDGMVAARLGEIIATETGSELDIVLSGKYAIRLKEKTKIKIARFTPRYGKGKAVFELIDGKTLISIEQGFKGSSFVVDTDAAKATALGTKFAIDVSKKSKTEISVLEGKVRVKSTYRPKKILLAKQTVIVGAGQKTEISVGHTPLMPQMLVEKEWRELEELYQIGKKPQVMLLIKNTPDRVKQLLRPCPIYISDEKPREIPDILEKAVLKMKDALESKDKSKHLESVKLLERIVEEYPNPKYNVQFLLYIGAYYEYLGYYNQAINTFEKVLKRYPNLPLASLAQCAIGVVYEENLYDREKADTAYELVLSRYPDSLEAVWVRNKKGSE